MIDDLESSMTEEEIGNAIVDMPVGRSPCPDGIPAKWCKSHAKTLTPKFCTLFNKISQTNPLPDSCYMAHIVIIPKAEKPPDCESYCPA